MTTEHTGGTYREVRRSARERRPRARFTYETLGQPSTHTYADFLTSQVCLNPVPLMPYMPGQVIIPTPYTPRMYMQYAYYTPVTTQVY